MLLHPIAFNAVMSASAALDRLARYGLWLDPQHPQAKAWIEDYARRMKLSFDDAARRLKREPRAFGAAIRRQWYANVLWYSLPARELLQRCVSAPPGMSLAMLLQLQEGGSRPPQEMGVDGPPQDRDGVVLEAGVPVAVSVSAPKMMATRSRTLDAGADLDALLGSDDTVGSVLGGGGTRGARVGSAPAADVGAVLGGISRSAPPAAAPAPKPVEVRAWPRLDAPEYQPAAVPFDVVVGLRATRDPKLAAPAQVVFAAPPGAEAVDVGIELLADGIDAPEGWTRTLRVQVNDPTAATVTFRLVGREPTGPEPVHLTMLEVRYVVDGAVCGTASRPFVVGKAGQPEMPGVHGHGTPWLSEPASFSSVSLQGDAHVADLTIEIAKPDGDATNGRYVCRLSSPHKIPGLQAPYPIDLGQDARTFAKSLVEMVRSYSGPLVDNVLTSLRQLIAEKLPPAAFDALRAVAQRAAPQPPAVLIVSAEPFVPWELAEVDPPLDAARPPYLGAQALVGRWLRHGVRRNDGGATQPVEKPACLPLAAIPVRHMAVMAGYYKAEAGLRRLPAAEQEATELVQAYDAVALAASQQALKQLLSAQLEHKFQQIGAPGAVHFAGHGDYDPTRPDSGMLFLSEGTPLTSFLFRGAKYGGERQPLFFLNACMLGIGGEVLGELSGFPGDCLKGGFGGVLGALWEIDDAVAAQVAREFWRRALPTDGAKPEPVAAILRDLRAKYDGSAAAPVSTYLSYVYYGHPRLTLQRAA